MWTVWAIVFFLILLSRLTKFLNLAKEEVTETIGEVVTASRLPSGRLTVQEMEQQDIHPYFCYREYRIVWVEHPSDEESCPWCEGSLIPCS